MITKDMYFAMQEYRAALVNLAAEFAMKADEHREVVGGSCRGDADDWWEFKSIADTYDTCAAKLRAMLDELDQKHELAP